MSEQDSAETPSTVLCVDDEPNILSALRRLFRPCGYRVLVAESGAQGLEILRSEPVDLVISDMRMPHMDGAQFLKAVKQEWPETVRILLTGYADIGSTIEAINQGEIYRYITKPWTDGDMLVTVRQALDGKALKREKERLRPSRWSRTRRCANSMNHWRARYRRTADLQKANEKVKQSFLTAVKIFSTLMEMRHPILAGHSRRVAAVARSMAIHMGMNNMGCRMCSLQDAARYWKDRVYGCLADPPCAHHESGGSAGLPQASLDGENALMALEELAPVTKLVRHHHERF